MIYIFIIIVIVAPTLLRAWSVSTTVFQATGQETTAFIEVLRNDAPLVGVILFFLVLTAAIRNRWLAWMPFLVAAAMQLALMLDIVIGQQFSQRLAWLDVVKFYDYVPTYILAFDLPVLAVMLLVTVVTLALAYLIFTAVTRVNLNLKYTALLLTATLLVSTISWQSRNVEYVHYRFYQNIISYNEMLASEAVDYSEEYIISIVEPAEEVCVVQTVLSGPVIIYMVESLSSYQSELFSGVNNWTPRLDDIARNNAALTDFYASGFTTEDGALSLLTAEKALYPPNSYSNGGGTAFSGHWTPDRSLPRVFNDLGYESSFITTSDLTFSSTGDWASAIGFKNVRGSDDPFYGGMERFYFHAAADSALVDNILQTVDMAHATPFFFAKTVTSHHPHIQPETGERSVEAVMRYVDYQISALYEGLDARGFFETGHLVIVGDHRAMLDLTHGEIERFGLDKAYAQVPAVVVSRQLAPEPVNITAAYGQTDLANTLMGLFRGETCHNTFQGVIWGSAAQPADYLLHRRGDQRNQVSVFSKRRLGVITLDGDDTAFSGDDFTPEEQDSIVNYVNAARITAYLAEQGKPTDE